MSKDEVVLFDVNHYMHRNYHGMPENYTSTGIQKHLFEGTVNMLKKHIKLLKPKKYVFCFDDKVNFRKFIYSDYKGNRPAKSDEFITQTEDLYDYLRHSGAPTIRTPFYEADDLIHAIAKITYKNNYRTLVLSRDKDLFQLVNEDTCVVHSQGNDFTFFDEKKVFEKLGVLPHQVILYLTLMGDDADNIKFVNGIGPKTAAKITNEYDSLADIILNINDPVFKKHKDNILSNMDNLFMSQKLIELANVEGLSIEDINFSLERQDKEKQKEILLKYEI